MGKISSGCDIVFVINGNTEDAIRMGSTLSSEQTSYYAIAKILMEQQGIKTNLRDRLKFETSNREVTREEIENSGIIHNGTVQSLVKKYPNFDWTGVDQSTKILSTNWFRYYGTDMKNYIIQQNNPETKSKTKIIVIDPTDLGQVSKLNSYLLVQAKLRQYSDDTKAIIDNSGASSIVAQLPVIVTIMKAQAEELEKLQAKEADGTIKKSERTKLKELALKLSGYESFKEFTPKTPKELVMDFMDNSSKYQGLTYSLEGVTQSIYTELNNILKEIEGKKVKEAIYQDIFANEIVSNSKWSPSKKLHYISQSDFIQALRVKLQDLQIKRDSLDKNSDAYKANTALSQSIERFLKLENKTPKHWNEIITMLIDQTDDEFSYSFNSMEKAVIYLNNVPRTLEQRYTDFTYKTISVLKPAGQPYKGFNIYVSANGDDYYYSRHILTTKSYGKKYKSREDCIKAIEQSIQSNPISQQSLIEFKTRGERDVVFIPNKFLPGQVIRSLNMRFSQGQQLNEIEQDLIYNTGLNNGNNLNKFYDYIMGIIDTKIPDHVRKQLEKVIDTAEKAACFIYALNESEGTDRVKIKSGTIDAILKRIQDAKYEYFVVESVSDWIPPSNNYGFKQYFTTTAEGAQRKGTYKVLLTQIQSVEINNNLVTTDEQTARLAPSIRMLKDLAKKIQDKLGVTIHIETQSTLEELFKEWNQEMPSDVKGFVKNGEIYINSSNATDEDLFHEYTHIMLGILKAKNYENYQDLVTLVAEKADRVKESLRERYANLADQDLNEEVFAEMFARYMSGRDLGAFLNGTLKDAKKAVDDKIGSIFGSQKITGEFYNATLNNVFRQFGYDLGKIMNEGNGLEISSGNTYRQASTWIEEQIKKYKDTGGEIGIFENCD